MVMTDEEDQSRQFACCRCHAQKLRCVRRRNEIDCVRCVRAGVRCVARPSKRVRQHRTAVKATQRSRVPASWSQVPSDHSVPGLPSPVSGQESSSTSYKSCINGQTTYPSYHPSLSWEEAEDDNNTVVPGYEMKGLHSSCNASTISNHFELGTLIMPPFSTIGYVSPQGPEQDDFCTIKGDSNTFHRCSGSQWLDTTDALSRDDVLQDSSIEALSYQPEENRVDGDRTSFWRTPAASDCGKSHTTTSNQTYNSSRTPSEGEDDLMDQLALLNTRLLSLRKDIAKFFTSVASLRCSSSSSSPLDPSRGIHSQSVSTTEKATKGDRDHVLSETLGLALSLRKFLDEPLFNGAAWTASTPSVPVVGEKPMASGWSTDYTASPHRLHEDWANHLLLLSCYSRLLDTFSDFITRIQIYVETNSNSQTSSKVTTFLSLVFPPVAVAEIQLAGIPQLQALTVLDFTEHLMSHILAKIGAMLLPPPAPSNADLENYIASPRSSYSSIGGTYEATIDNTSATFGVLREGYAMFSKQIAACKQTLTRGYLNGRYI